MNEIEARRHEFERTTDGPFWAFVMKRLTEFRKSKSRELEMVDIASFSKVQGTIEGLDFALGSSDAYERMLKDETNKSKETEETEHD